MGIIYITYGNIYVANIVTFSLTAPISFYNLPPPALACTPPGCPLSIFSIRLCDVEVVSMDEIRELDPP
jgi:hypothetical protein